MEYAKNISQLTEEDIDNIMYIICREAPSIAVPFSKRLSCDAGCGRVLIHNLNVPTKPPKICEQCAEWVGNCKGEA